MGCRGDLLDEGHPRALRLRQPRGAALPTPAPEEQEEGEEDEEEEEFLRREELRGGLGAQATSSWSRAFRRAGPRATRERAVEPGGGRLEGATSPGPRRQLRLRGRPSEGLLQRCLTLCRSDAMGTSSAGRRPSVLKVRRPAPPRRTASRPLTRGGPPHDRGALLCAQGDSRRRRRLPELVPGVAARALEAKAEGRAAP